jgi:hypothetical protein
VSKDTEKAVVGLSGAGLGLDELVRHGARQVVQQAIEAELAELMERFANVKTLQGQRATVRHRTTRTRNCVSRPTFRGLAFKLIEEAQKTWRRINGPEKIKLLLEGITFKDCEPVQDDRPLQQKLAA